MNVIRNAKLSPNGNKTGSAKTPDGRILRYEIVDEIEKIVGKKAGKKLVLQKILFSDGRSQLRLGYYVLGQKEGNMKGHWVWGRNAPFMDFPEFQNLLESAKTKGWI